LNFYGKKKFKRKPQWLKKILVDGNKTALVRNVLEHYQLNTICTNAKCPNRGECYARKTATFLILGELCTRNCVFCAVEHKIPLPPNPKEPENIALAVKELALRYVVITSVTRDDLSDGGANHFVKVIKAIRKLNPSSKIEPLIPDFQGKIEPLHLILNTKPYVLNHNIETVPRLYSIIRPKANYKVSLQILKEAKKYNPKQITKSGLMVGLGEESNEIIQVMKDLCDVDCDILTIGQYLRPSKAHYPVMEFITPEQFEYYKQKGLQLGFKNIISAPLVRSSYLAEQVSTSIHQVETI